MKLTPYSIPTLQQLKDTDISSRLDFANWMTDNESIVEKIWFSDKSHFYLDPELNKQNHRYWSSEKPILFAEKLTHVTKVTVWAALSVSGMIGPYFFEDSNGNTTTINSERYLQHLKQKFLPTLSRKGIELGEVWFQQDGAAPHTAQSVLTWFGSKFDSRVIS